MCIVRARKRHHFCLPAPCSPFPPCPRYLSEAHRYYYVTPTSYLALLQLFTALLARQQEAVEGKRRWSTQPSMLSLYLCTSISLLGLRWDINQLCSALISH